MGKHDYSPVWNGDLAHPIDSRKWITHQWNSEWESWELSGNVGRHEKARLGRYVYLGHGVENGNHHIPFREWSKEKGLSDYVLLAQYHMDNSDHYCFRATNGHIVCLAMEYGGEW